MQLNKQFSTWFISGIILVPLIAFGVVHWYEKKYESLPVYPPRPGAVFSFTLEDQRGQPMTDQQLGGKITVVNFFFTHCPVVCPKMTNHLKEVQQSLSGSAAKLQFFSFSVDPERDSVSRLADYAQKFNINPDNWRLLTGDKKAIYRLARNRFAVVATDGDGGPNDFIHSDQMVLLDARGRIRGYYDGTDAVAVQQLATDVSKLFKE